MAATALRKKGLAMLVGGKFAAAAQALRRSLNIEYSDDAWMALGIIYQRMGNLEAARQCYHVLSHSALQPMAAETARQRLKELVVGT